MSGEDVRDNPWGESAPPGIRFVKTLIILLKVVLSSSE
jgi:hypothetical protein